MKLVLVLFSVFLLVLVPNVLGEIQLYCFNIGEVCSFDNSNPPRLIVYENIEFPIFIHPEGMDSYYFWYRVSRNNYPVLYQGPENYLVRDWSDHSGDGTIYRFGFNDITIDQQISIVQCASQLDFNLLLNGHETTNVFQNTFKASIQSDEDIAWVGYNYGNQPYPTYKKCTNTCPESEEYEVGQTLEVTIITNDHCAKTKPVTPIQTEPTDQYCDLDGDGYYGRTIFDQLHPDFDYNRCRSVNHEMFRGYAFDCADIPEDCDIYQGEARTECVNNLANIHPGANEPCTSIIDYNCDGVYIGEGRTLSQCEGQCEITFDGGVCRGQRVSATGQCQCAPEIKILSPEQRTYTNPPTLTIQTNLYDTSGNPLAYYRINNGQTRKYTQPIEITTENEVEIRAFFKEPGTRVLNVAPSHSVSYVFNADTFVDLTRYYCDMDGDGYYGTKTYSSSDHGFNSDKCIRTTQHTGQFDCADIPEDCNAYQGDARTECENNLANIHPGANEPCGSIIDMNCDNTYIGNGRPESQCQSTSDGSCNLPFQGGFCRGTRVKIDNDFWGTQCECTPYIRITSPEQSKTYEVDPPMLMIETNLYSSTGVPLASYRLNDGSINRFIQTSPIAVRSTIPGTNRMRIHAFYNRPGTTVLGANPEDAITLFYNAAPREEPRETSQVQLTRADQEREEELLVQLTRNSLVLGNDTNRTQADESILRTSLTANRYEGRTEVQMNINTDMVVQGASILLEIPDCAAEHISEMFFEDGNFEIIRENPLIAWHFTELSGDTSFSYEFAKEIDDDCLEQLKVLSLIEGYSDSMLDDFLNSPIFGILLIPIIATLLIYFSRFSPSSTTSSEPQTMEKEFVNWEIRKIVRDRKREGASRKEIMDELKGHYDSDDIKNNVF